MSSSADIPSLSLRRWYQGLDTWVHEPRDPALFAWIRIAMGTLLFLWFTLPRRYVELWWSDDGFLPFDVSKRTVSEYAFTLFDYLPHTKDVLWTCWWIAVAQSVLLIVGFLPRLQAASLFVWLLTFHHRNGVILDGEDTVFRLFTFFMVFMPLSDVWSVDAWLLKKMGRAREPKLRDGWAVRLMQIQVCIVLWAAGLEKLDGGMWWEGSSMYYVLHLDDFATHLPLPDFMRDSLLLSQIMTWSSLTIEIGAPILVWFAETRRVALIAAILLHFGIEYMMNLFLFEWIMLIGWSAHVRASDLVWARSLWARLRGAPAPATEGTRAAPST